MATNPFNLQFDYYKSNPIDYKKQLSTWIISNPKGYIAHLKGHHQELLRNLDLMYSSNYPIVQKLYLFTNNMLDAPLCQTCGNRYCNFLSFKEGYSKWCCNRCAQLDEHTKERVKQTKIQRFGFENNTQCPEFKEQMREIRLNRSQDEKNNIQEKRKSTCIEKYGVDHPCKSTVVKTKIRESQLQNLDEIQQNSRQMCFELHGCQYTGQIQSKIDKTIDTFNLKYGKHPFCIDKNGYRVIENVLHCDFNKERGKKYSLVETNDGSFKVFKENVEEPIENIKQIITLDSTWEIEVFKYCSINGLEFQYQPNIQFHYEYDGKTHSYHPDFLINGRLYEVKGDHFFNEFGQMINPYDRGQDGLYEAKHQCMLSNGVTIIRQKQLNNLDVFLYN